MEYLKELEERNKKIIEVIIEKINLLCKDSVDIIGIYGSFQTGDIHEKSDLDLMIVINDNKAWQISKAMIIDDIGYDVYCTPWERLEEEAKYNSPYISKLIESKIIYLREESTLERLEELKNQAKENMGIEDTIQKSKNEIKEAKVALADLVLSLSKKEMLLALGEIFYRLENALCFINKKYFKLGVKRHLEEINKFKYKPLDFNEKVVNLINLENKEEIIEESKNLIKSIIEIIEKDINNKEELKIENIRGTYEEMYSNWRNKVYIGSKEKDLYSVFSSMVSLQILIDDISKNIEINSYDILKDFNSKHLDKNISAYDDFLRNYLKEYEKVNLKPSIYKNIDEFISDYLQK